MGDLATVRSVFGLYWRDGVQRFRWRSVDQTVHDGPFLEMDNNTVVLFCETCGCEEAT